MIHNSETLISGIHHIFYGYLNPKQVLERYEARLSDHDLYHYLREFPESPRAYMAIHDDIRSRWHPHVSKGLTNDALNQWRPSFYEISEGVQESFHVLCDFYRLYIHSEFRMMIDVSEMLKETLEMHTLKYELLTLRDELLDLLRETSSRLDIDSDSDSETVSASLPQFVYQLILNHSLITLSELMIRSGHLFEDSNGTISMRDIYLNYIKRPPPRKTPWCRTVALTQFELELTLRSKEAKDQLPSVEALLSNIHDEASRLEHGLPGSVNLLENVWFCLFVKSNTDSWQHIDPIRPDQCALVIEEAQLRLFNHFTEPEHDDSDRQLIASIIKYIDSIRTCIRRSTSTIIEHSAAARLVASVEAYYSGQPSVRQEFVTDDSTGAKPAPMARQSNRSTVLDNYILFDELIEKLGVTPKSLKTYLSDSKTPIHKFSNKTKLIHINDLKDMMDHFKTDL